jgi:uracil-DNA glycosylase
MLKAAGGEVNVGSGESFEEHLELLFGCRACPLVEGRPVTGAVPGARLLLVGQAPGPREEAAGKPFAYTAGQRLFRWLAELGVSEEEFRLRVYMAAVIRCFPGKAAGGGDRVPSPVEIAACSNHLDREIRILRPSLVIAVGSLAAQRFVPAGSLDQLVGRRHRVDRAGAVFDLVVLPHPSGRSTWTNKPENAELLRRSLSLIARHPAFRETFGRKR